MRRRQGRYRKFRESDGFDILRMLILLALAFGVGVFVSKCNPTAVLSEIAADG